MKALVLSDSHGVQENMMEVINNMKNDIAAILFLGDCIEDMEPYQGIGPAIYKVPGNCDMGASEPPVLLASLGGKRIFMTHGDGYSVKLGHERLVYKSMELEADVCLFGHTHYPACFYKAGILFLNPGSISLPRGIGYPSYGLLEITKAGVTGMIFGKTNEKFTAVSNF